MIERIRSLKKKLEKNSKLILDCTDNTIIVKADHNNGIDVSINIEDGITNVSIGNWHEHFEDHEEALNYFGGALTKSLRLKVYLKGNFEYKWTVEEKVGNHWIERNSCGSMIFPFWKKTSITYKQNFYY